ncbi:MAG TPA: SRPBCC family protein [Pseudonocardiaceae bacterium]
MTSAAEPTLQAEVHVRATPEAVWDLVSDIRRMGEWSPQCRGGVWLGRRRGPGARFVGINRAGWRWWPTTNRVVASERGSVFAFRTEQNRAIWSFHLEADGGGTRLVQRRELPEGRSELSRRLIKAAMGGNERFDAAMERGMRRTLERVRAVAEAGRSGRAE